MIIGVGVGMSAAKVSVELPVLFSDDFNRADAATLGAPWSVFAGSWGISGNAAKIIASPDYDQIAYVNLPGADKVSVKARVQMGASDASIIVRYNPDSRDNFYQWGKDGRLYRNVAGAWNALGSYNPPSGIEWAELEIVLNGANIDAYYNGLKVVSVTDTALIDNKCFGMRNGNGTSGVWDDFEIKAVAP